MILSPSGRAKLFLVLMFMCLFSGLAKAEMVPSTSIGNDPSKEKLCASRAGGKTVPFEIDSRYVAQARALHPDATFIAVDGMSPQLIECHLRQGTGKFEPDSYSPEQGYWHLIRPVGAKPGQINNSAAIKSCADGAIPKIGRANFDHSVSNSVAEVNIGSPLYHPGAVLAGKTAERYDIAVKGTAFYKSSGPDLDAVKFTCLLSPALNIKAIQLQ